MSFLAPLYLLAGLAISLPILFHMIRRTPRGRQLFSSLMFLSPSPPRMTNRSRIEDWLLLLLRSLAVILLAFAFARPFLRAQENIASPVEESQRIVVLLDTSASMRREGYWEQAIRQIEDVTKQLQPRDAAAFFAFDKSVRPLLTFDDWKSLPPEGRRQAVSDRLKQVHPGWESTAAGNALLAGVEQLQEEAEHSGTMKTLVMISDLQAGGGWDVLNSATWPEDVVVRLIPIDNPAQHTNAALQTIQNTDLEDGILRVRVSNASDSRREAFQIGWGDEVGKRSNTVPVYVPAGESRVVRAPAAESKSAARRLILTGDDVEFDNVCFVAQQAPRQVQVIYFGAKAEVVSPSDLRFFLSATFPSTPTRHVKILDWSDSAARPEALPNEISLLIIGGDPNPGQLEWIRKWTESGGQTLFVARNPQQAQSLYGLLAIAPQTVEEADVKNYAMFGKVDLNHPVLQMFDDPRFSDFTKLRFWHSRKFDKQSLPGVKVLLEFEDGTPAVAEIPLGQGRIVLFASGWNRDDSDLAVWSKFVPLMNGLLDYLSQGPGQQRQAIVGDELALAALGLTSEKVFVQIDDQTKQINRDDQLRFDRPGIYEFAEAESQLKAEAAVRVAVNLDPNESRTEPLPLEVLESAEVKLRDRSAPLASAAELRRSQQRQLMNQELESRQKIWRWLMVSALGLLLLETALAGWRGRARLVAPE